jgi:hypothetical protein
MPTLVLFGFGCFIGGIVATAALIGWVFREDHEQADKGGLA